ncbi:MAG: hypothetical protein ACE5F7_08060 [Nitrospiria bacterium]
MTSDEYLELGLAYIKQRKWGAALSVLRECEKRQEAPNIESFPPQLVSALGLCLAMAENKILTGLDYCERAVQEEVYRAEFHYHLGLVHLKDGNKRDAVAAFYKGLKFDAGHSEITKKLYQMGIRKKRSIRFLGREHVLNKVIGKLGA